MEALAELNERMPDLETLFDVSMPDAADRDLMMEHAREMLLVHNLKAQQTVVQITKERAVLQDHARALELQVSRDGLTGVFNRAHMDTELAGTFEKSVQSGKPVSVLFVDLDHFNNINDTWGHDVGDQVLIAVARRFAEALRPNQVVGRYGGEEFVVLLPETGKNLANGLGEALGSKPVAKAGGKDISVSFSGGLATHGDGHAFAEWTELVHAADRVMYAAKTGGRAQTVAYC
jgi:diguanylate cyclase